MLSYLWGNWSRRTELSRPGRELPHPLLRDVMPGKWPEVADHLDRVAPLWCPLPVLPPHTIGLVISPTFLLSHGDPKSRCLPGTPRAGAFLWPQARLSLEGGISLPGDRKPTPSLVAPASLPQGGGKNGDGKPQYAFR